MSHFLGHGVIILLDADAVMYADGGVELDASEHALVQMSDSPDSPPTASTTMTSLWQMNLVGLRLTRYLTWQLRRSDSVAMLVGLAA